MPPRCITASAAAAVLLLFAQMQQALAAQQAGGVGSVFVIDLENHNWTQPDGNVAAAAVNGSVYSGTVSNGGYQQIYGNSAAPYINSLVTPGNGNSAQVSYCSSYYNVLATPSGNNPSIHPSELNYIWQENGNNDGVINDNDPYYSTGPGNAVVVQNFLRANPAVNGQHLTGMMQTAGISWKSYDEDANLLTTNGDNANSVNGTVTNTPAAPGSTTVPLSSLSGTSSAYTNVYNGSHQYNYAAKHVGSLFFTDTNGGYDTTTSNSEASHYAPLQQLQTDLNSNSVSLYNLIVPDQYNDMHTGLYGGFNYNGIRYTGDASQIAQADKFLSVIIPQIQASAAYKNNGAIVIWTDETEPDSTGGSQNDYTHSLSSIVISPLAKGNAYRSDEVYTHSSDLATMQEIFGLTNTQAGLLNDAGASNTNDLSDLFSPGVIPSANTTFANYTYIGAPGSAGAPVSGTWSSRTSWLNGIAPTTSTNKELDFVDSGSSGFISTNDNSGAFTLNALLLRNNSANGDVINSASGSSLSFAGTNSAITQMGNKAFSISSPITIAANPLTINGTGSGALTLGGAISGTGFGLAFNALNVTTLAGANTFTGPTTINSGTVVLDYSSQNNSKLSNTTSLTLGAGTLQINGNQSSSLTQTVAGLRLSGGAATINIATGQTSLALGAISFTPGSSVNFINNGIATVVTTSTGIELGNNYGTGIIGAYAVYNGTTWATLSSNSNSSIIGFTAYGSTTGSTGTIDPIRESLDLTSSDSNFNSVQETLRYNTAAAITTTVGSSNINFSGTYGGILMTANVGANNNVIQGNLIESGGDFYVHQYDTLGTLTISSQFMDAGNSSYNLVKDGPGTLYLSFNGVEHYGGNVYLNGGLLSTAYLSDLQNTLIFNGGGLQPTNGIQISNNAVLNAGGGTVDIQSGSFSLLAGTYSGVGGFTKTGMGTATLSSGNSYIGGTLVAQGTLVIAAPGALPTYTALSVGDGATAVAASYSSGIKNSFFVSNLSVAARGRIDLKNNDLVIQNGSLSAVWALVAQGFNNGLQGGYGVTSTVAAADSSHLTTLGVIQNSVDGTVGGPVLYPNFDGNSNGANTDVLVKYTYFGDANLDGKVDASDYSRIDGGYITSATGWFNGDFNYDGLVNGSDYTLIDNAFNSQGAILTSILASPLARITSEIAVSTGVPEPHALGIVGFFAANLTRCRRHAR